MAKYTFIKDFNYTYYGIAPIPKTIKKGQSFEGLEIPEGIVISLDGSDPSNYKKEIPSPDLPSPYLTVPKEYLTQSSSQITDDNSTTQHGTGLIFENDKNNSKQTFFQKHKNHLLIIGAVVLGYLAYKKFKK
jgi:hypothetical protein